MPVPFQAKSTRSSPTSELGLLTAEDLIKRVRNDRTRVCVWWFGPGWRGGSRKQEILDWVLSGSGGNSMLVHLSKFT